MHLIICVLINEMCAFTSCNIAKALLFFLACIILHKTYGEFSCTSTGRFVDPESLNCSDYYLCIKNDDSFYQLHYTCPEDSRFNSEISQCTNEEFSCEVTTTTLTTTVTTTTLAICANGFMCVTDSLYLVCDGSEPSGSVNTCPSGTVCRDECAFSYQCTDGVSDCTVTTTEEPTTTSTTTVTTTTLAPCANGFMCVTDSMYLLCNGSEPSGSVSSCPSGTTCRNECAYSYQCTDGVSDCTVTTTEEPTTTSLTTVTTTTLAPCANGFMCVTDSLYLVCNGSEPGGSVNSCPSGTTCRNECAYSYQCTDGVSDCTITTTAEPTTTTTTTVITTTLAPCANGFLCVTDGYYLICNGSEPSGSLNSCPSGTSCRNECAFSYQCTDGQSDCTVTSSTPTTTEETTTLTTTEETTTSTTTTITTTTAAPCANGFVCITESWYLVCAGSVPAGSVETCPSGTVCRNECMVQCFGTSDGCI